MRKRLDFYIHDALKDFAKWYVEDRDWLGKERDCVNLFALDYLSNGISEESAIKDVRQIRIECAVAQPRKPNKFPRPSAAKDLVIWKDPLATTWDADWKPKNSPRAIIEWKHSKSGNPPKDFHGHDREWLESYTAKHSRTLGFLVSTHATTNQRSCMWAIVRGGVVGKIHTHPMKP